MTEEDQVLVTRAALAGVRFWRREDHYWLSSHRGNSTGMYSIGRAAAVALRTIGLMTEDDTEEYLTRSLREGNFRAPVDVDISALAGCQLDNSKAEEPPR